MLAEGASLAAAQVAADVHLGTGLGEGEIAGAQAYLGVRPEHLLGKQEKHLLEVGEGHVLVDIEPFHLMEEAMCTGRDGLVAVYAAGTDDTDGGLVLLHHAGLHATGVAAQDNVGVALDEEGVLHIARRMVVGKVHAAVHVPVVLHFGSFGQRESQSAEDVHNFVAYDGEGMACSQMDGVGRAGEVDAGTLLAACGRLALESVYLVQGCRLELVDAHAHLFLLCCGHASEVVHQGGNLAFLAQVLDAQGFGFLGVGSLQGLYLGHQFLDFFYHLVMRFGCGLFQIWCKGNHFCAKMPAIWN